MIEFILELEFMNVIAVSVERSITLMHDKPRIVSAISPCLGLVELVSDNTTKMNNRKLV